MFGMTSKKYFDFLSYSTLLELPSLRTVGTEIGRHGNDQGYQDILFMFVGTGDWCDIKFF